MALLFMFSCLSFCLVAADIVFPGETRRSSCKSCKSEFPLQLALRLDSITDENQLFQELGLNPNFGVRAPSVSSRRIPLFTSPDSSGLNRIGVQEGGAREGNRIEERRLNRNGVQEGGAREGNRIEERQAVTKPKAAPCIPELRTVSLRKSEDPRLFYWPSCTRVEQCGGCCSHHALSCQAIETQQINFQVSVLEFVNNMVEQKTKEIVPVEKHTKCKCVCIIKEKDCNTWQEYREKECRCACKNRDEEANCYAGSETKHWNPETCSCECLRVLTCSTGTYFSPLTCSCEPLLNDFQQRLTFRGRRKNSTFRSSRLPTTYSIDNGK